MGASHPVKHRSPWSAGKGNQHHEISQTGPAHCTCRVPARKPCAVSAIDAGETRTVIGADLTDDQIKTVYKTFGIERGSVKELTVTNKDERQYLSGVISDEQIGTKSISCISIEVLDAGKGMTVNTSHITYCTSRCTSARWPPPASRMRKSP